MKRNKLFFLFLLFALLWAAMIFNFSAQNADTSGGLSIGLSDRLFGGFLSPEAVKTAESVLRKIAHFSLFFGLGFLSGLAAAAYRPRVSKKRGFLAPLLACFLYAVSDEVHQIFVAGRACRAYDVVIDTVGAAAGLLVLFGILALSAKLLAKKKKEDTASKIDE